MAGKPTNTETNWRNLHLWQIQPVRDALVVAGGVGLVWLGYKLSIVTVPILLALLLAYLFEPLVARMTQGGRVGRARVAASIIVLALILVGAPAAMGLGYSVVQGVKLVQSIADNVDLVSRSVRKPDDSVLHQRVADKGTSWASIRDFLVKARAKAKAEHEGDVQGPPRTKEDAALEPPAAPAAEGTPEADVMPGAEEPSDLFRILEWSRAWLTQNASAIGRNLVQAGGGAFGAVLATIGSLGGLLFGVFLTAFFFFFFSTGYGKVLVFWQSLLPEQKKGQVLDLVRQMDAVISGFIRGRLIICSVLIVVYTLGFWFIGVPAAFIVGPITGMLTLIPYAAGVMLPVAMLLSWLDPGDGFRSHWWWIVGSPLGVTAIAQVLDDYVLTPRVQGKTTNMDTPTILFASIAGGSLAGFYGLLIAIPTAACIKILLRELFWPRFRQWASGKASDVLPISKE
ncbi:MAG: AI-2E family transporter [Planctomycetes bacterium]|nr:AI-2E family transporter [Planctomycetota bacterium]